ncbi:MAG TPA: hypothetical protein VEQ42_13155 [Pyrinomonadaceae bacterium]|nr:hypothetical protein [Pyrinomonadaceae bacterium]
MVTRTRGGGREATRDAPGEGSSSAGALRCRRKFLRHFPGGFQDAKYLDWERDYKLEAHERWQEALGRERFRALLKAGEFEEAAARAVRVEQRTRHSMLFSFEKMALRDAVRTAEGARTFAEGLYEFLHGRGELPRRFDRWCAAVERLPRRQTRVLTWPLVTVFGFLSQPRTHIFLKPNVTRRAAREYGFDFRYESRPSWEVYANYLEFAETVRRDLADLAPRDMIDLQSFLWVQGSDEYD